MILLEKKCLAKKKEGPIKQRKRRPVLRKNITRAGRWGSKMIRRIEEKRGSALQKQKDSIVRNVIFCPWGELNSVENCIGWGIAKRMERKVEKK